MSYTEKLKYLMVCLKAGVVYSKSGKPLFVTKVWYKKTCNKNSTIF